MNNFIELTTKNFSEASKTKGKDDFCISIGQQKVFCHSFVAAFLSSNISRRLISDPTLNAFNIEIKAQENKAQQEEKLSIFLKHLIKGERIEFQEADHITLTQDIEHISQLPITKQTPPDLYNTLIYSYITLIEELDNDELREQFYSYISSLININTRQTESTNPESISKEEIENRLKKLRKYQQIFSLLQDFHQREKSMINFENIVNKYFGQEYSSFIDEIAAHFYEIDESLIINTYTQILNDILSSSSLKIKNEEALMQTLLNRRSSIQESGREDDQFFFEKVRFVFLSENGIRNFLNEVSIREIDEALWSSISRRLVMPVSTEVENDRALVDPSTFLYYGSNEFDGILNHFTKQTNGNIHKNGTVEIKCSNLCCGSIETLVNFNDHSNWVHVNGSPCPRWLQIDFKGRKVQINSYMICASEDSSNKRFIKHWAVEISENGNSWEKVDERNNNFDLNEKQKKKLFRLKGDMTKPFRYIRIITDKPNHQDSDGFTIGNLELYGRIIE
ncbi:hypothetical protein M9Y10_037284 [Tritrichomonas musculus]|uniref:F5/8 type C domain-containing protein n=1 Tax=Tritrichomonas musculus TaxID=1915356 RepID=A0ABR2GT09_9EUKA